MAYNFTTTFPQLSNNRIQPFSSKVVAVVAQQPKVAVPTTLQLIENQ